MEMMSSVNERGDRIYDAHPECVLHLSLLTQPAQAESTYCSASPAATAGYVDQTWTLTRTPERIIGTETCGKSAVLTTRAAAADTQAPDHELVEAAKSGDETAFTVLSRRHSAKIQRRIFRIVRNHEDSEDVLQETMLRAFCTLRQFRGTARFSTWLTRIAINCALMSLRKKKRNFETPIDMSENNGMTWTAWDLPDPSPNPEQIYARKQTRHLVSQAVGTLPGNFRGVIRQFHQGEASMKDAADALGLSVSAAKSRLVRARHTLRSALLQRNISST